MEGNGAFEFALDSPSGPFQESPVFNQVINGPHTIFVRDRFGCGIAERDISLGLPPEAFPKFFTPNGDGINDYWQINQSPVFARIHLQSIHIFDRYGSLLAQVDPGSPGWDGKLNGNPLPSSNYWFTARDEFDNEIKGYFALKR